MKKGLSTWLFSKLVMFSFLVIIFGIMAQMMVILNDRAYADAATLLSLQVKEAAEGIFNSDTVEIQKIIPLPQALPQKGVRSNNYYLVIKENSNPSRSISFSITRGTYSKRVFVSSSLIYIKPGISTNLGTGSNFNINSQKYHYLLIRKEGGQINFYGCRKFYYDISASAYAFKNCTQPGGISIDSLT